jgi:hypothetical protein
MTPGQRLRRIRVYLVIVVIGLVVSGVTAFPLEPELRWVLAVVRDTWPADAFPNLISWLERVHDGLVRADTEYPFLRYGTDWLAFAHLVIAVAFWGPLRDPVRNVWVVQFGMIACAGIIPLALICGPLRGIPFWWQVIDMSFGVIGVVPLLLAYRHIRVLERVPA